MPTDFGAADDDGKLRYRGFPPTIFVVMTGGNSRLDAPGVVEFLRDGGVPADVITVRRTVPPVFVVLPAGRCMPEAGTVHHRPATRLLPLRLRLSPRQLHVSLTTPRPLPLPPPTPSPPCRPAVRPAPRRAHLLLRPHPGHHAAAEPVDCGGHDLHRHAGCRRLAARRPGAQQERAQGEVAVSWR